MSHSTMLNILFVEHRVLHISNVEPASFKVVLPTIFSRSTEVFLCNARLGKPTAPLAPLLCYILGRMNNTLGP